MAQFEAFEEGDEVDGQTVQSMVSGVGNLSTVFEEHRCPCDFDRSIATAVVEQFRPPDSLVNVSEESDQYRTNGGEECIYGVAW